MDFKEIKRLIALVEEAKISAFRIDTGSMKIEIEKNSGGVVGVPGPTVVTQHVPVAVAEVPVATHTEAPKPGGAGPTIKSPMVGTFYASPSPDAPAFIKEGDTVAKGQVVCIVEAMKLFNDIESDVSGTIEKILVKSGDTVEYGQDLFVLRA